MQPKYTNEQIRKCCLAYRRGTPVATLVEKYGVPRSTIYFWIKKYQDMPSHHPENYLNIVNNRSIEKKRREKLQNMCEILQKVNCTVSSPLQVKLYELEKLYGQYNVRHLCEALQVDRGTFYNHVLRNKKQNSSYILRNQTMRELIRDIYDQSNGIYGARKIHAIMVADGHTISLKFVKQLMSEMNLKSIRDTMKKQFLKSRPKKKNIVDNNFTATAPNQKWVSDITQFHFNDKSFYICAIIDLYSRKIVGYKVSNRSTTQLITSTFKLAFNERNCPPNLIFHSDRGCQYTSYAFQKLLAEVGATQSFSRARTPGDNSVMESFFASLKKEELYRKEYTSVKHFKNSVVKYMTFYNEVRPHKFLRYISPNEKERRYKPVQS